MPSFDVVCEADMVEVKNAVEQSNKEITTRFDFKGSSANVEQKDKELTLFADSDFQLTQVKDVLINKMAKRKVDVRFLDEGKVEKIGGDKVKLVIKVRNGIETDDAKKNHQAGQGKQDEGAGEHPGRIGAHHRRQARRPADGHGHAAQGRGRPAAGLQQLPRLIGISALQRAGMTGAGTGRSVDNVSAEAL